MPCGKTQGAVVGLRHVATNEDKKSDLRKNKGALFEIEEKCKYAE